MPLHLEKKAIRALGIAESFSPNDKLSVLAGVVMRSDLVIDGFGIGSLKVSGSDATDAILSLFEKLNRNDINMLLLSGSVLSLYNIVDVDSLCEEIKIPILALTFKKSKSDLEQNIKTKFAPQESRVKIRLLRKLGMPDRFKLKTGYPIFVRSAGVRKIESQKILDKFTLQGAIPEPIRVARLLSRSVAFSSEVPPKRQ